MKRYNSTPRMVLGLMSPDQAELAKLRELLDATGEVGCRKLLKCLTSSESQQKRILVKRMDIDDDLGGYGSLAKMLTGSFILFGG